MRRQFCRSRLGTRIFFLILTCFMLLTGGLVTHTYWVSKRFVPEILTSRAHTALSSPPFGTVVKVPGAAASLEVYFVALAKEYVFVILVSGGFTFLVVLFFFRRLVTDRVRTISRHFQELAASTRAVDLSPVGVGGTDEISDLAISFNHLLDRLISLQGRLEEEIQRTSAANRELEEEIGIRRFAEARLQELNETLEGRVVERTATLSATLEQLRQETMERQKASKDLDRARKCFHGAVENSKDAIIVTDHEGIVHYFNPQAENIFGISRQKMLGVHLGIPITASDSVEIDILNSSYGSTGIGDMQVSETFWDDQDAYLITVRDITERKRFEESLARLAGHDHLTGLLNRRRFEEIFQRELDRVVRYKDSGALVWFDLDNFKEINDNYGHRTGDEFLVHVAQLLRDRLRDTDVLARFGGDEFVILLPRVDKEQAASVAAQLLTQVNSVIIQGGADAIRTTASVGVALFPEHGTTIEELLVRADSAMYQAKHNGRNCYEFYDPAIQPAPGAISGLVVAEMIRTGLENRLFELHLQPIFGGAGREEPLFFEVLLRLRDRDGELVGPSAFMQLAEKGGLVRWIDRWVVSTLLQTLEGMNAIRPGARYSINLSARTLSDDTFLDFVRQEIAQAGADPGRLVFEVTESAAITNLLNVQKFIAGLGAIGCDFALDDFGVGFSSFSYIKHLPVSYLKIDGSFITGLAENEADRILVRALQDIARGLGMKTVAEWVETESIREILSEIGVDYMQGYLFGKPEPWAEALRARALT